MASPRRPPPPQQPVVDLPPGFSFTPQDDELLSLYLRRKVARSPLPPATARFIHDADVYAAEPATLVAGLLPAPAPRISESKKWYLFSHVRAKSSRDSRRSRTVGEGKGTWHSEKARKDVVDGEGRRVGYRQSFTYWPKNGDSSGWLMVEFGVDQEDDEGRRGESVPVLCKIYQTPRPGKSASNSSSSRSQRKRKRATDERSDLASSARVRRRLFPSPPAPNPPTAGATSGFLDDFLMPVEPQPEAEESQGETSKLNDSFFMADGSELRCYGTTLPSYGHDWGIPPCASIAENSGSWTGGDATTAPCLSGMGFLGNFSMPVEQHPEPEESQGETSAPGYCFSLPDHARSALSCYSTTVLSAGAGWAILPSAPYGEKSGSWTGGYYAEEPCMSGMDFLAGLPVAGFGQDASLYWCGEPSAPGSAAASTPLCSGAEWSSVMHLPLHG